MVTTSRTDPTTSPRQRRSSPHLTRWSGSLRGRRISRKRWAKPVWLLDRFDPYWRSLHDEEECVWYAEPFPQDCTGGQGSRDRADGHRTAAGAKDTHAKAALLVGRDLDPIGPRRQECRPAGAGRHFSRQEAGVDLTAAAKQSETNQAGAEHTHAGRFRRADYGQRVYVDRLFQREEG